jgi:Secretion system C-terminal sorting domain
MKLNQVGGIDHEFVQQHSRDIQGNILITGDFRNIVDLDPGIGVAPFNSKGIIDAFLLKLNGNAEYLWAKTFGSVGVDYGQSVVADQSLNVIITGRYSETVDFGGALYNRTSRGGTDVFLVKMDQNGNTIWANSYGDVLNDQGNRVVVNNTGIIYLAGIFRGSVDFNLAFERKNESTSNGGADAFVLLSNQDGTYNEHFDLGGIANEQINDFVLKSNGELISVGGYGAIVDFDPTSSEINIISSGGLDGFMVNIFICVNPYIKNFRALKSELCEGERAVIQIVEGYLNSATQWSWQRDSCDNITFASGTFIDQNINKNTTYYLKGWGGCVLNDECKRIDISIFRDSLIYQDIALCEGDTLFVGNSRYTTEGVFIDTLSSKAGCDSIVVSEISVFPIYSNIDNYTICTGDTIRVGTSAYTLAGTYVDIFPTIHGCDSTIISIITLLPATIENADVIICKGDSITVGNETYTTSGTFIQSSEGTNGCENLLIVRVKVLETVFENNIFLCNGDSIVVGSNVYKENGLYVDSLESTFGCDSVITTRLTILQHSSFTQELAICNGDSIIVGNSVYRLTGNFVDTLVNTVGCDSIVFTDLRILDAPIIVSNELIICQGDSIIIGGNIYTLTGVYTDTLSTISGCDSIVITDLNVNQKFFVESRSICLGDSVVVGDSTYYETGTYTYVFSNTDACDSIILLDLEVFPNAREENLFLICPGDVIRVGDSEYTQPGNYIDRLQTVNGCDSIIVTRISWNHVSSELSFEICEGDSIRVNGKIFKNAGNYSEVIIKSNGCDSTINFSLTVFPKYETNVVFEICKGGQVVVGNSTYFNEGMYAETLQSMNGCDSIVFFQIVIINFTPFISVERDTLKSIFVEGAQYQWYECVNGTRVEIFGAKNVQLRIPKSGSYALAITYKGCTYFSNCLDVIISNTENTTFGKVKIFPNPVVDKLNFVNNQYTTAEIISINGSIIISAHLLEGINAIDISDLTNGFYILKLTDKSQQSEYHNIIKQ